MAASKSQHAGAVSRYRSRDYNYVLHLSGEELALLKSHRDELVACTAGFAEVFYNYLFDNPDIADVLYTYEREGGDVGQFARAELGKLLASIVGDIGDQREAELLMAGRRYMEHDFRPVWLIGAYNLLIDYVHTTLSGLDMHAADRIALNTLLTRLLLREMGIMLEGYWMRAQDHEHRELETIAGRLDRVESMLASIPHLMWSVDINANRLVYANYTLHLLYEAGMTSPLPCIGDTHEEDRQLILTAWQEAVSGNRAKAEVRIALADDLERWYRVSLYPETGQSGRPAMVHCMLEDVQNLISEREQLQSLATTDRLTGLPNRSLWADHLTMALAASRRAPGSQVVVISLDINQFKMYNDTLGRDVGDILLCDVATRLRSTVRESDSLARLGGDHFGILLQPVNNAREAAERISTEIMDKFDLPFVYKGKQLCVSLTLGIACFPGDGNNEEALLANAESAMQRAKRNSVPYQYFDPVNDVSPAQQLRYSGQIRSALDNDEFELLYQPLISLDTERITGAEALLRWRHPIEGIVMPERIIPVAEQLGLITPITNWVLVTALRQCREWSFQGTTIPVSVNVSARSFQNPRLLEKILWALEEAAVEGDRLVIEITEATLMQDIGRATELLSSLSEAGVTIAIDDFGTGYSSLSYLKRLPIDTLKIDQSFVTDVAFDRQDIAIVRSIIDLGHNLGYKVVAEGVENSMTMDALDKLGCDIAQGFHISKPLPDERFSSLLVQSAKPS
ncbi:MAG: EAL domain-containing protein [Gammaproteobacteria bacterium]